MHGHTFKAFYASLAMLLIGCGEPGEYPYPSQSLTPLPFQQDIPTAGHAVYDIDGGGTVIVSFSTNSIEVAQ